MKTNHVLASPRGVIHLLLFPYYTVTNSNVQKILITSLLVWQTQSHFMCLEIWQFEEARANLKIIFKRSFIITYYRKKYASH